MENPRYRSARQRWLGETLTMLQRRGLVIHWDLKFERRGSDELRSELAFWWIEAAGVRGLWRKTAAAETAVQRLCDAAGIRWIAVSPPGGIAEYRKAHSFVFDV